MNSEQQQQQPPPPRQQIREVRTEIWQAKAFGNWVREVLVSICIQKGDSIVDLSCSKGIDLSKWERAEISAYTAFDPDSNLLNETKLKWQKLMNISQKQQTNPTTIQTNFIKFDLCDEVNEWKGSPFDHIACLDPFNGAVQRSFESERTAKLLLSNVSSILKAGGLFFGVIIDSSEVWRRCFNVKDSKFSGKLFSIQTPTTKGNYKFELFGTEFNWHTNDNSENCTSHVVHFPTWVSLASEQGLQCLELQNFLSFNDDYSAAFAKRYSDQNLSPLHSDQVEVISFFTTFIFKKI